MAKEKKLVQSITSRDEDFAQLVYQMLCGKQNYVIIQA